MILRAATRSSPLALWQTNHIASMLGVEIQPVLIETAGDKTQVFDTPIPEISGQGVFVKEVQAAVRDGRADIAVHSAKDMTSEPTEGLTIACVPERSDPRDAIIGCSIDDLPPGASVATGSVRRRAQLAGLRPDLQFFNLRGNIDTRLAKAAGFDAVLMAHAALVRLDRQVANCHVLEPEVMLPQVAQGALAVECRSDDVSTLRLLEAIEHAESRRCVDAERAFLSAVGGNCDLPVAGYAVSTRGGIFMRALVAAPDGATVLRAEGEHEDGIALGVQLANRLMDLDGGRKLLKSSS